jgi:hypothetical protein
MGFTALEAAVVAACQRKGISIQRTHPGKIAASESLRDHYGLPDISQLLADLNVARKAAAYGDTDFPTLDAEGLATAIEQYVNAVSALLNP